MIQGPKQKTVRIVAFGLFRQVRQNAMTWDPGGMPRSAGWAQLIGAAFPLFAEEGGETAGQCRTAATNRASERNVPPNISIALRFPAGLYVADVPRCAIIAAKKPVADQAGFRALPAIRERPRAGAQKAGRDVADVGIVLGAVAEHDADGRGGRGWRDGQMSDGGDGRSGCLTAPMRSRPPRWPR
ncbi:hypothetical protein TPA0908_54580 [Micromonospora sp. AKA38]|nr:hypothetical protein TPA0908_54580 [Micromonospora sp. AKA38]